LDGEFCGGKQSTAPLSHALSGLERSTRRARSKAPSPLRFAGAVHDYRGFISRSFVKFASKQPTSGQGNERQGNENETIPPTIIPLTMRE
jgi:hypothetical protein